MIPKSSYTHHKISDVVPVLSFDPKHRCYELADGESAALGFMFACRPLVGGDDSLADRLAVMLNMDWPTNTIVQFTLFAGPDIIGHLEHYRNKRNNKQQFLRELNELQEEFFKESVDSGLYRNRPGKTRDVIVIVSCRIPHDKSRPATSDELESALRRADAVESVLDSCRLDPIQISPGYYIRLMQTILDTRPDAAWRQTSDQYWNDEEPINEQIGEPGSGFERDRNKIKLANGRVLKVLSTKRWPEQVYFGQARRYLGDLLTGSRGISDHCLMTLTCHFPDNESQRQKLSTKRNWVTQTVTGPLAKFLPQLAAQKHSFDALFQAVDEGDRIVRIGFSVVMQTNEAEQTRATTNATTYLRECGFQFYDDQFVVLAVLLNALPLCGDPASMPNLQRFRSMAARHAVSIAPLFSDWKGTGTPMIAPVSRAGQIMSISPFDSTESYNVFVAGSSGGGKSFSVNDFIIGVLSMGGKAWCIDVGRSYTKICSILGGQLLDFDASSKLCLNPFELVTDFNEESDMILHLLQSMASTNDPLSDLQTSMMRKTLRALWEAYGNNLMVDHVAEALLQNEENDARVRDVGRQLYAFTSKGEYGRFFNGKNNVRLDSDFVVVELEGLKEKKQLLKVVLLMLIYQVRHDMTHGDRSQQKLFIVEEAWSLLEDEVAGAFVAEQFRTARKYGGAAVVVSQNPQDVANSKGGQAIISCCPNVYLLPQRPDVVSTLRKNSSFGMSDGEFTLLESLHTMPGVYSEIMFQTTYGRGIGRLVVPELKKVLYSTTPTELEAIKRLQQNGATLLEAVRHVAKDRERRVAA